MFYLRIIDFELARILEFRSAGRPVDRQHQLTDLSVIEPHERQFIAVWREPQGGVAVQRFLCGGRKDC